MAKPKRPIQSPNEPSRKARTFFVTSSTWERRSFFQSEQMARLFLTVLSGYRAQGRYLLHAFVLMLNHFHALITVPPGTTVERAV